MLLGYIIGLQINGDWFRGQHNGMSLRGILMFYYAPDLARMSEFMGTKLLVSAAAMMSTAIYGY